jgi:glycosyltransferase involved in cell wall biosynthesis
VCYLTKRFPRLSETFILDEILGLEAAGVPLRLFSIANPAERTVQSAVAQVKSPVSYLRSGSDLKARVRDYSRFAVAHARLFRRNPLRWIAVVGHVMASRRHASTLRHLAEAGLMATEMDRVGATHIHAAFAHGPASIAHFVSLLSGRTFSFAAHAKDLYLSSPDILAIKASAAEFVLACSHSAADELRRVTDAYADQSRLQRRPNIVYAPHGVDTTRFRPLEGELHPEPATSGHLAILAVGRLVPKKGYATLLDALGVLRDLGEDFECRIVGGGDLRNDLESQVAALDLCGHVTFAGTLTQDEIVGEYHRSDVVVQASVVTSDGDRDGIPNVVLEAMASGVAVIATSVAGIPEVIEHASSGILVAPGDPGSLAVALRQLTGDADMRRRLATNARAYVSANLSRPSCIAPVAELLAHTISTDTSKRYQPRVPVASSDPA